MERATEKQTESQTHTYIGKDRMREGGRETETDRQRDKDI